MYETVVHKTHSITGREIWWYLRVGGKKNSLSCKIVPASYPERSQTWGGETQEVATVQVPLSSGNWNSNSGKSWWPEFVAQGREEKAA